MEELRPYEGNARTHSDAQVAQIAASMREWGWTNPVLVDEEGSIVAGHGRVLAAIALGWDDIPVMVARGWTEAQKRAYVLADNKIALGSGWDMKQLGVELQDLRAFDFDAALTGFSEQEIALLTNHAAGGLTDPDHIPEAPDESLTERGFLYACGPHRVLCGDSTVAEDVKLLLGEIQPHLMVTDPPYGVEYDANWRNEADRGNGKKIGDRAIGKVQNDDRADWSAAWSLFSGDVAYVWHAGNKAHVVADSIEASGFDVRAQIIWAKNNIVIGRGHYHPRHEPCWYAVRRGKTGHWNGDRKQSTVWNIDKPMKSETGHSTQKPVECMLRPIMNNSSPGQAVYDPFLGSGTTMIAAEQAGRVCYGMEINPLYVDVAVKRWEEFTGRKAERTPR